MFLRRLSRLASSDHQNGVNDINHKIYWIWTNLDPPVRLYQKKDWKRKKKQSKGGKKSKQQMAAMFTAAVDGSCFTNLFLFGF